MCNPIMILGFATTLLLLHPTRLALSGSINRPLLQSKTFVEYLANGMAQYSRTGDGGPPRGAQLVHPYDCTRCIYVSFGQ